VIPSYEMRSFQTSRRVTSIITQDKILHDAINCYDFKRGVDSVETFKI